MTDTLLALGGGFAAALSPINLLWALAGCLVGTAIGVLPGVGPAPTLAMLLPLTAKVEPASALILGQAEQAIGIARHVADELGHIGVLTCEFFACADGPVFNEIAPRVHNSGHWTIEGAVTSQFENHIRAVAGWPLGLTQRLGRIVMDNLVGDEADRWEALLKEPGAHLHLYGKADSRPGRKMGHVTRVTQEKA